MRTLNIPGTDLNPSVLALGTVPVGSTLDQAESFALLDAYVAGGGTFIDTARVYSDWLPGERNSSEKTIGRWLAARGSGLRDSLVLATKGGHPPMDDMRSGRLSNAEIRSDLEGSLRDLGVDHIDLYWLHRDDPSHPVEDIIDTFSGLVQAGQIRFYGASNWSPARIEAANRYAQAAGKPPFVANQMMWSLAEANPGSVTDDTLQEMDAATRELHRHTGLTALPYTSQALGFFGGRYARNGELPAAPAASRVQRTFFNGANFGRLDRVNEVAARLDWTPNQVALAYLRAQSFPVFPIIGPRTLEQLSDSLAAGDLDLDAGTAAWLETGEAEQLSGLGA
ncbi:aldo/keto reductase (plasmid) [Deinococcus radiomollis]|uniref:aldo/keto reductase n=1 Tax=Deinococcus radiomollis TaxID=468916 RepID=UPI003892228C